MNEVVYSSEAVRELEEIGEYISEKLKSPMAAMNTLRRIQDKIDNLKLFRMPEHGCLLFMMALAKAIIVFWYVVII